ncbi:MAG: xanthine dehydrogenase family protein molybdopterin-binding subunit [Candidatus Thiodiazotropha sp.]
MNTRDLCNLSRRRFLMAGGLTLTGLTLGILPMGCRDARNSGYAGYPRVGESGEWQANAFLNIDSDDRVTVISKHLEMGQGVYTGLAMLVAEELDADWSRVRVEGAPADSVRYSNLAWGGIQGTGGSNSIANAWEQMCRAGAAARQMLIAAAARHWQVNPGEIEVAEGVLRHPDSGRAQRFGEVAGWAAQEPVPEQVSLKDPGSFKLIGRSLPRKDTAEKLNGQALFTQDLRLPGMLTAVVRHPPRFGARVLLVDAERALAVKGVRKVVELPTGVAVIGEDFWSARQGREALSIVWDEYEAFSEGSEQIFEYYRKLAATPGDVATERGDVDMALRDAEQILEVEYQLPYLAHAAMEPLDCVVRLDEQGCEIWNGEQSQTRDQIKVAELLGIPVEQVRIHMLYAGGSFGRRANPAADYLLEAMRIAQAVKSGTPVKMIWTREDDTRGGYYRPAYLHRLKGGVDEQGLPRVWDQRIVGQSILKHTALERHMVRNGVDRTSVEGAANLPYRIPHLRVDLHSPESPVPVLWWRSVGSSHTAFAVESFIDELAARTQQDPLDYRRHLLGDHPRHLAVLNLAADRAGWSSPLPPGRGRGIAVHESFNTCVAMVTEVSVAQGLIRVDRVVIAVDCGIAVNPDAVRAQMEGGMGFGLSAVLESAITFKDGRVEQGNFDDYKVLRIDQMPQVEVHILASAQPPSGAGEPATPVIAPAVANAVFAATGHRLRELPLRLP